MSNLENGNRGTLLSLFQRRTRLSISLFILFFLSCTFFARHANTIGHKLWLVGWAYKDIFHPPEYDPVKVETIARMKLYAQFHDPSIIRIVGHHPYGEECIVYTVEHFKSDGSTLQFTKKVRVHWKPWTMNNGEKILYESDARQLVNAGL